MENEVTRALKMRRSIRSYSDKTVDDEARLSNQLIIDIFI